MDLSSQPLNFKRRLTAGASVALALSAAAAALSGCTQTLATLNGRETFTQGYVIDQQAIDMVPVGSSREQVLLALGTPSTEATLDNKVFYYISQKRVRSMAFQNPHIVDQRVFAVYFGPDDRVVRLANYGLKDGKVFDFLSRTTPTGGKDTTFLSQVLTGLMGGGSMTGPKASF
jgi:outer membrane protein assembly factor BamE (lipoprotein component of BamABCDE complex)